jgi:hypothetical protein
VLAAYRTAGLHRRTSHKTPFTVAADKDYAEYYDSKTVRAERDRIRASLQRSGLAQLLPGGLTALPGITEATNALLLPLTRLLQPHKLEHLVSYVARNLDWYLAPHKSVLAWHRLFSPGTLMACGCLPWMFFICLLIGLAQICPIPIGPYSSCCS